MSTASDVPAVSGEIEQRLGDAAQAVREREVILKRCSGLRARRSELETGRR
jgi:hypothetical protein